MQYLLIAQTKGKKYKIILTYNEKQEQYEITHSVNGDVQGRSIRYEPHKAYGRFFASLADAEQYDNRKYYLNNH